MASKLIVNEIEHTSGSGVAVTFPAAGITGTLGSGVIIPAAGVTGVLPVGVTGGSGLDAVSAGKILKVKNAEVTSVLTTTAYSSPENVSGLAVTTDTPASSSSKFLIMVHLGSIGSAQITSTRIHFIISGGNMATKVGDADTGHESLMTICPRAGDTSWTQMPFTIGPYLDNPASATAVTYQVKWWLEGANQTGFLNRSPSWDANSSNTSSSIIVMEVA